MMDEHEMMRKALEGTVRTARGAAELHLVDAEFSEQCANNTNDDYYYDTIGSNEPPEEEKCNALDYWTMARKSYGKAAACLTAARKAERRLEVL